MKIGSKGIDVRTLQQRLNKAGANPQLIVDGLFGESTKAAVIAFQKSQGIIPIGIAGPRTQRALQGIVDPKHASQNDLQKAAEKLGVSLAVMATIAEVESIGEGFFGNTGKPIILFERHVFHERALASGLFDEAPELEHKYPNVCNPAPGGYAGGNAEYQRFKLACTLSSTTAKESCSWGMFQIMGYHWQILGYDSVDHFVAAMHESEANHIDAVVRFIKSQPEMHKALQQKEWSEFAYRYNGPAYHRNLYDVKLKRAYEECQEVFPELEHSGVEPAHDNGDEHEVMTVKANQKPASKRKSARNNRGKQS
ncbi:N-acetylmuramidase domain-containing protein [Shewanella sp.]|uniref:N-acetylmuramidase domain-containing protein n=1 Tax=Shewanella sp. TaxID=50422 RepID=UPI003567538D